MRRIGDFDYFKETAKFIAMAKIQDHHEGLFSGVGTAAQKADMKIFENIAELKWSKTTKTRYAWQDTQTTMLSQGPPRWLGRYQVICCYGIANDGGIIIKALKEFRQP